MTLYKNKLPSRKETLEKLEALVQGKLTPEEASNWASPWIINDPYETWDDVVWRALSQLCGADLPDLDGSYLHGKENFITWLNEFQQGCILNPEK